MYTDRTEKLNLFSYRFCAFYTKFLKECCLIPSQLFLGNDVSIGADSAGSKDCPGTYFREWVQKVDEYADRTNQSVVDCCSQHEHVFSPS